MIAFARPPVTTEFSEDCRERFEPMIAKIRAKARFAFRWLDNEARDDLIQEVVANAWVAFCRLWHQGRADAAYPTPLANFAIRQVCAGRRVGAPLNGHDAMSEYAQQRHGFYVTSYDNGDYCSDLGELLTESRRWTPADHACSRLDFAEWLRRLPTMRRRVAHLLATGETTQAAAKRFGLSPGRISQIRRELEASWSRFSGEGAEVEVELAATA